MTWMIHWSRQWPKPDPYVTSLTKADACAKAYILGMINTVKSS